MNDDNDAPEEVAAISLAEDVDVVVSYLKSPSELYIQAVQSLPLLNCMMMEQQSPQHHNTHYTTLQDSALYLALCEGVWYRARVISISPSLSMARVTLVDFGVTDTVEVSRIRALTVHRAVQPLARKVKLVTCNSPAAAVV